MKKDEKPVDPKSDGPVENLPLNGVLEKFEEAGEFEDVLDHLGAFGHWQRMIFTFICVSDVFSCFSVMVTVFSGATPSWSCSQYTQGNMSYSPADLDINETSASKSCSFGNYTCSEFFFNDFFTSIVSEWSLVCDKRYVSDLISSLQMSGQLIGAALFGQLSDTIGRKMSFFLAHGTLTIFGLISGIVPKWEVYTCCRIMVGVGFGGTMAVSCVYPLEFVGHKWRILTGTFGFWAIAQMILALIAYLLPDWKHLVIATSASGLVYFITWAIIPESPRWLVQKGRLKEAKQILDKIAHRNHKPTVEMSVLRGFAQKSDSETILKKYTYLDLFKRWKYAKITIATITAWFATFLSYYVLSYNMRSFSGNRSMNMFYGGIADLMAMFVIIVFANWIGRKIVLISFLTVIMGCSFSLVCLVATESLKSLDWLVIAIGLLGKAGGEGGAIMIQIYTAELYPTVIRNLGVGIGSIVGRVGGILAPQIIFLGTYSDLVPFIVPTVICALSIPCVLSLYETKGVGLGDVYHSQSLPPPEEDKNKIKNYAL